MIYLDNAATSFHKPDCVPRAVVEAMQHAGNSGRGSSGEAMAASRLIFNTRCQIAEMFDVWGPECVCCIPTAPQGSTGSPDCGPGERQALGRCWA